MRKAYYAARKLARTAWQILRAAVGWRVVSRDFADARLAKCLNCRHMVLVAGMERCGEQLRLQDSKPCGCFVRLKVRIPEARCPLDYWGPVAAVSGHSEPARPVAGRTYPPPGLTPTRRIAAGTAYMDVLDADLPERMVPGRRDD